MRHRRRRRRRPLRCCQVYAFNYTLNKKRSTMTFSFYTRCLSSICARQANMLAFRTWERERDGYAKKVQNARNIISHARFWVRFIFNNENTFAALNVIHSSVHTSQSRIEMPFIFFFEENPNPIPTLHKIIWTNRQSVFFFFVDFFLVLQWISIG